MFFWIHLSLSHIDHSLSSSPLLVFTISFSSHLSQSFSALYSFQFIFLIPSVFPFPSITASNIIQVAQKIKLIDLDASANFFNVRFNRQDEIRDRMRWDGMRWDGMRWDVMRWDVMRWDGIKDGMWWGYWILLFYESQCRVLSSTVSSHSWFLTFYPATLSLLQ